MIFFSFWLLLTMANAAKTVVNFHFTMTYEHQAWKQFLIQTVPHTSLTSNLQSSMVLPLITENKAISSNISLWLKASHIEIISVHVYIIHHLYYLYYILCTYVTILPAKNFKSNVCREEESNAQTISYNQLCSICPFSNALFDKSL